MSGAPWICEVPLALPTLRLHLLAAQGHEGDRLGLDDRGGSPSPRPGRRAQARGEADLLSEAAEVVEGLARGLVAVVEDERSRRGRKDQAHRRARRHQPGVAQGRAVAVVHLEEELSPRPRDAEREHALFAGELGLGQAQPIEHRFSEHALPRASPALAHLDEPHPPAEGGVVGVELEGLQGEVAVETIAAGPSAGDRLQADGTAPLLAKGAAQGGDRHSGDRARGASRGGRRGTGAGSARSRAWRGRSSCGARGRPIRRRTLRRRRPGAATARRPSPSRPAPARRNPVPGSGGRRCRTCAAPRGPPRTWSGRARRPWAP